MQQPARGSRCCSETTGALSRLLVTDTGLNLITQCIGLVVIDLVCTYIE